MQHPKARFDYSKNVFVIAHYVFSAMLCYPVPQLQGPKCFSFTLVSWRGSSAKSPGSRSFLSMSMTVGKRRISASEIQNRSCHIGPFSTLGNAIKHGKEDEEEVVTQFVRQHISVLDKAPTPFKIGNTSVAGKYQKITEKKHVCVVTHHDVVSVENGDVLEDFPGHADELRYDQAADGKHSDAPVLSFRTPTMGINARKRNVVKHRTVGAGNNLTVQNLYDPQQQHCCQTRLLLKSSV